IGDLPLSMQSKLLRVLQEKEIMRIGGKRNIPIDIRIIAATNIELKKAMENGRFREDLFYRLNIIPIEIPPLRRRKADMTKLTLHFIAQYNKKYKVNKIIKEDAIKAFVNYEWPGNVRELKNIIERIIVTLNGEEITEAHVLNQLYGKDLNPGTVKKGESDSLQEQLDAFEKKLIKKMLDRYDNAAAVAKALKVNKSTISRKIKKYNL
ncbi:MAG: sigma 54-interacting transcriptional regulator, partial [Bacillota bacterium]